MKEVQREKEKLELREVSPRYKDVSTLPYAVSEPAVRDAAKGTFTPQRRVVSGSST